MKRKKVCVTNDKGELATVKVKRETQVSKPGAGLEVPQGRIQYGLPSRRYRHAAHGIRSR